MSGVKRTPQEWATIFGLRIVDPDGWREPDAPPFDEPCELSDDLTERLARCTVAPITVWAARDWSQ